MSERDQDRLRFFIDRVRGLGSDEPYRLVAGPIDEETRRTLRTWLDYLRSHPQLPTEMEAAAKAAAGHSARIAFDAASEWLVARYANIWKRMPGLLESDTAGRPIARAMHDALNAQGQWSTFVERLCAYATRPHTVIAEVASLDASEGDTSIDDALRTSLLYSDIQRTDGAPDSRAFLAYSALADDFGRPADDHTVIVLRAHAGATESNIVAAERRAWIGAGLRKHIPRPAGARPQAPPTAWRQYVDIYREHYRWRVERGGTTESFVVAVMKASRDIGRISGWFGGGADSPSRRAFEETGRTGKTIQKRLREATAWLEPVGPDQFDVDRFMKNERRRLLDKTRDGARSRAGDDDTPEKATPPPMTDADLARPRDGQRARGRGGRPSALTIKVDDDIRTTLTAWLERPDIPVERKKRARAILLLADGHTFSAASKEAGLTYRNTHKWATRFAEEGVDGLYDR